MANFQTAYYLVADAEGGYQNHHLDRGNYNSLNQLVGTNYGIAAPTYESWIGRPPTTADMRAITPEIARQIFKVNYWDRILGDQIQSQAVANIWFDGQVNHGRTGTKIMQRVVGVPDDGQAGPITLAAVNAANPEQLVYDYREARRAFYYQLVQNNPSFSAFLQGWLNRLATFEAGPVVAAAGGGLILLIASIFLLKSFKA